MLLCYSFWQKSDNSIIRINRRIPNIYLETREFRQKKSEVFLLRHNTCPNHKKNKIRLDYFFKYFIMAFFCKNLTWKITNKTVFLHLENFGKYHNNTSVVQVVCPHFIIEFKRSQWHSKTVKIYVYGGCFFLIHTGIKKRVKLLWRC